MKLLCLKKNELKSQLKGTTHCFDEEEHERLSEQLELLASKLDEYDLIVDERNQLKKQLKEKNIEYFRLSKENNEYAIKLHEYKTQQKEFIKYLEDEISKLKKEYGNYVYDDYSEEKGKYDTYIEILQKYKSIIGDDK